MSSIENYQIEYDLFVAESELFNSIISIGSLALNESVGLIYIEEGVKETITNYISKITEAIQKAWERFKELVTRKADQIYLKSIEKKMENPDPHFTITNYPEYDIGFIESIEIVQFEYESMKQYLDNPSDYCKQYYSNIMKDPTLRIKENIEKTVLKSKHDKKCTADLLKGMYKFVKDVFPKKIADIENDLKKFNASNKNIQSMISQVTSAETTQEAVILYLSEADEQDKDEKTEFKDDPEAKKNDNKSITKHVTTYLKVSTDIITAKMYVYKEVYNFYMKTIKHYVAPDKKKDKEEKSETNNTNNKTQVDIN